MAVMLETSRGDMVIDLFTEDCPKATQNFLKLCAIKYYNNVIFHQVQHNFVVQTGDPDGTGRGGSSIWGVLYGEQGRFFEDEIRPHLKHKKKGVVAMAGGGENANASQFYITTGAELDSLDGKHTIFGEVSEGLDVLDNINNAFVDKGNRPLQNIRIKHTHVLDDPFPDPPQLAEHTPAESPPLVRQEEDDHLEDDWAPDQDTRPAEVIEEETKKYEAQNRAVVLEMIGDLPEADSKPPTNMLFVCKLNQVTTEEDLEIIFSRFGNITSCDIIKDWKTGDSLCYAFLGFDNDQSAEEAYFKMNNVLIDDRRIKVDFSQSVYHLWKQFRRFGKAGSKDVMGLDKAGEAGPGPDSRLQIKVRHGCSEGRWLSMVYPAGSAPAQVLRTLIAQQASVGGMAAQRGAGSKDYGLLLDSAPQPQPTGHRSSREQPSLGRRRPHEEDSRDRHSRKRHREPSPGNEDRHRDRHSERQDRHRLAPSESREPRQEGGSSRHHTRRDDLHTRHRESAHADRSAKPHKHDRHRDDRGRDPVRTH